MNEFGLMPRHTPLQDKAELALRWDESTRTGDVGPLPGILAFADRIGQQIDGMSTTIGRLGLL